MGILDFLKRPDSVPAAGPGARGAPDADVDAVRRIVSELDAMPPERARWVAAFAYLLGRIAHSDLDISQEETAAMVRLLGEVGELDEGQAVLVVEIAKRQNQLFGGTENFLVAREFRDLAGVEERRRLLACLLGVAAADESISSAEEREVKRVADELGLDREDYVEALSAFSEHREVLRGLGPKTSENPAPRDGPRPSARPGEDREEE